MLNTAIVFLLFVVAYFFTYLFIEAKTIRKHIEELKVLRPVHSLIEGSGLKFSVHRWLFYTLLGVLVGIFSGIGLKNTLVAVLLAIVFASMPTMIISLRTGRFRIKMEDSLAVGIEVFASEYASLGNVAKSFETTAKQLPDPIKSEFDRIAKEIYSGYRTRDVLNRFKQRVNNRWSRQFVNLLILRDELGANIEDALFNLVKQMNNSQIETQREKAEMAQVQAVFLVLMGSAVLLFLYNLYSTYEFVTTAPVGRMIVNTVAILMFLSVIVFVAFNRRGAD